MERTEWQEKMGVGERQHRFGLQVGASRDVPVIQESGKVGGKHTQHWDGRVDATIVAPTIVKNVLTGEVHSE